MLCRSQLWSLQIPQTTNLFRRAKKGVSCKFLANAVVSVALRCFTPRTLSPLSSPPVTRPTVPLDFGGTPEPTVGIGTGDVSVKALTNFATTASSLAFEAASLRPCCDERSESQKMGCQ